MLILLALAVLGVDPSTSGLRVRLLLGDGRFAGIEGLGDEWPLSTIATAAPSQGGVRIDPAKAPFAARLQLETLAKSLASRCELTTTFSGRTWRRGQDGSLSLDCPDVGGLPSADGCRTLGVDMLTQLAQANTAVKH